MSISLVALLWALAASAGCLSGQEVTAPDASPSRVTETPEARRVRDLLPLPDEPLTIVYRWESDAAESGVFVWAQRGGLRRFDATLNRPGQPTGTFVIHEQFRPNTNDLVSARQCNWWATNDVFAEFDCTIEPQVEIVGQVEVMVVAGVLTRPAGRREIAGERTDCHWAMAGAGRHGEVCFDSAGRPLFLSIEEPATGVTFVLTALSMDLTAPELLPPPLREWRGSVVAVPIAELLVPDAVVVQ